MYKRSEKVGEAIHELISGLIVKGLKEGEVVVEGPYRTLARELEDGKKVSAEPTQKIPPRMCISRRAMTSIGRQLSARRHPNSSATRSSLRGAGRKPPHPPPPRAHPLTYVALYVYFYACCT